MRARKSYATRYTMISAAATRGANLKWLADYCGTSVAMIDEPTARSYPKPKRRRSVSWKTSLGTAVPEN